MDPVARGAIQQEARELQGCKEEGFSVAAAGTFGGVEIMQIRYTSLRTCFSKPRKKSDDADETSGCWDILLQMKSKMLNSSAPPPPAVEHDGDGIVVPPSG